MRNLRKSKRYLLIFLIIFPTLLSLSSLIISVQGGPYIPEPNYKNGWHWEVDEGDHLYFEGEFILTNATTGEVYMMFKDIWIFNITSILNVTLNWLGLNEFSQVNATLCYYNVTSDELEAYNSPEEIALFGYNNSDAIKHKIRAGKNGMPFILPINGSNNLEVDVLDDIINESFYYPMSQMRFNRFDYYESTPASNRIYFSNSTDRFFSEGYYYNNGTLRQGSAYLMTNMGDGPVLINATMKQVFDYNITDEIDWGVNVGDKFYYDWYEDGVFGEYYDVMVEITNITTIMVEKTKNGFSDDPINMEYQAVFADIYTWNGTDYSNFEGNYPVGTANNFYPQYFDISGPSMFNFLYPITFMREDFEFMWNNDTLRIWDAPFDEIYYYENGVFESVVKNSTSKDMVKLLVDKSTGIVQSYLMQEGSNFLYYEIKTMTLVDWSINIGDVIYFKNNGEEFEDVKVTILSTNGEFMNMTMLIENYNSIGIPMTLPAGQPEYQFFSSIEAAFEEWDPISEAWINYNINYLAIANIYWPIAPYFFSYGPPLIMPEGTTSPELSYIFDIYSVVYNNITYGPGAVILTNTTVDKTLSFYFDEVSGRVTMISGWAKQLVPGEKWNYMSIYPKFYRLLTPGINTFTLNSDFPAGITVNVELEITGVGAGAEFIYNYFSMNPVNVSLPEGTPLAYFDQLITYYSLIGGNITMTIQLPLTIDLNNIEVLFFAFNMSGTEQWDEAPSEFYDAIIYEYSTNSIIIEIPAWDRGVMSAMAYIEIPAEEPEIPGYNPLIFIVTIIIISAFLIKKSRK